MTWHALRWTSMTWRFFLTRLSKIVCFSVDTIDSIVHFITSWLPLHSDLGQQTKVFSRHWETGVFTGTGTLQLIALTEQSSGYFQALIAVETTALDHHRGVALGRSNRALERPMTAQATLYYIVERFIFSLCLLPFAKIRTHEFWSKKKKIEHQREQKKSFKTDVSSNHTLNTIRASASAEQCLLRLIRLTDVNWLNSVADWQSIAIAVVAVSTGVTVLSIANCRVSVCGRLSSLRSFG